MHREQLCSSAWLCVSRLCVSCVVYVGLATFCCSECERDYSVACPDGWSADDRNVCHAGEGHVGFAGGAHGFSHYDRVFF